MTMTPLPPLEATSLSADDFRSHQPLLAAVLAVFATLFFASGDVVSKYLLATYDVPLVSGIRYMVHVSLMVVLFGPHQRTKLVLVNRTGLVLVRSLCLVVGTLMFGLALQLMPVAETIAVVYLSPMLVLLLARPLLGEPIGMLGWVSALGGFIGVLMIVRPGNGLDTLGLMYAVCNIGATVAYNLLSRVLARSERTLALLFYSALVGAVCFGLAMPWFWFGTVPPPMHLGLFVGLGILAGMGHFCFTAANRYSGASLIAPMTYTHLLWAGLLGWLVFGQFPDLASLAGMGVLLLAGVATVFRSLPRSRPQS